ncbi:MAG: ZIP family metal transporter [Candidatus Altiarchaeota archaeon]|nr:ZIP family metal transporter [Candidatus Altiarchaeota archaeon]
MDPLVFILAVSVLGPLVGSLAGVLHRPSLGFMCNLLSFAAGVMLAISFLELVPESIELSSVWFCVAGIVAGSFLMYLLDRLIPHIHPGLCSQEQGRSVEKTAFYLFMGIFLHNFPEGMAIAVGMVSDLEISLVVAVAIAIHNVPESICTSAPYYFSTGRRLGSFIVSASTAIPTVLGFVFAYFLYQSVPLEFVGFLVAATAGIMIYISADELIPFSCDGCKGHGPIFSLIAGVVFVVLLTHNIHI